MTNNVYGIISSQILLHTPPPHALNAGGPSGHLLPLKNVVSIKGEEALVFVKPCIDMVIHLLITLLGRNVTTGW